MTTQFPDLAGLQKSDDGTEFIYGGSVGINRVLGHLRLQAYSATKINYSLYLINVMTLIRNVDAKDQTDKVFLERLNLEIQLLILYISSYAGATQYPKIIPTIVFYIPDYKAIPKAFARPVSDKLQRHYDLLKKLVQHLPSTSVLTKDLSDYKQWLYYVGGSSLPHIDLSSAINKDFKVVSVYGNTYRTGDPICLITHFPIDLYLHRRVNNVHLLESYTGAVKTLSQFGTKINGNADVPFNPATHVLFGDDYHIAPLVKGKEKKMLLELATEKQWLQKPITIIVEDIKAKTSLTAEQLLAMRL